MLHIDPSTPRIYSTTYAYIYLPVLCILSSRSHLARGYTHTPPRPHIVPFPLEPQPRVRRKSGSGGINRIIQDNFPEP